jgi:protein O-GlcNAc transferase
LASEPAALAAVKARLAGNLATAPLFDAERYRRGIEAAYLDMVAAYRGGAVSEDTPLVAR